MKRTKLMLGVAALSAALLGTGYAAMTDVLQINSTVNTAKFDVNFNGNKLTVGKTGEGLKEDGSNDKYEVKKAEATTGDEIGRASCRERV